MTVAVQALPITYNGNGTASPLPVPFRFLANDHLVVTRIAADGDRTVLTRGTHYNVTGGGDAQSGTVTPLAAIAVGDKWEIDRATPREQPTAYPVGDDFPAKTHELALDRAMLVAQEHDRRATDIARRSPLALPGQTAPALDVTDLADGDLLEFRGGRLQRFNSAPFAAKFYAGGVGGRPVPSDGLGGGDLALRGDLAGEFGQDIVGTKYPEAGAKLRPFAEVARKEIELSGFTDADPTGSNDSMAAFKNALAACASRRAQLVIDGYYRLTNTALATPPTITQPIHIVGRDPRRANIPGNNSTSQLYFDGISADGIIVNDTQLTVDGVSIVGRGRDTSGNAIRTIGENSALRLCKGALIQSFQIGVKYENGYYHVIDDATIVDCVASLVASFPSGGIPQIYNLICDKLKVVAATQSGANSVAASIFNGSQVLFSNSSFESFTANGIDIAGNTTTVAVTDCYFEGFGGANILLQAGAAVNAYRNYVYLNTGAADWINCSGDVVSVNAGGNRFQIFEGSDTGVSVAYKLRLLDATSQSNIGGDQWSVAPGPNTVYVESPGNATYRRGKHVVQYPVGHPRQFEPINTLGFYGSPGFAGGYTPPVTSVASWLANGDPTNDDPIGLRAANGFAWGGNPYLAVYQKGQWEKVGLRMLNIADATDEADALIKFNTLLVYLRSAGVMLG